MMTKLRGLTSMVCDEEHMLTLQTVVFIALPILYLCYLGINMRVLQISMVDILSKSSSECLNMILKLSSLYAAYIMMEFTKHKESKFMLLAYTVLLFSQLLQGNLVTICIMVFYTCRFLGIKQLACNIQHNAWGKGALAFSSSIAVLIVSLAVLTLKIAML